MTETIILNILNEMAQAQKNFINGNDKKNICYDKNKRVYE